MSRFRPLHLCVLSTLVACHESESSPAPAPIVQNLGLAVRAVHGQGELRFLVVAEEDQGPSDLNGDGDVLDLVFFALDLESGRTWNTGLVPPAPRFVDEPPPILAQDDRAIVFKVGEREQGVDFNSDGDLDDVDVHLFERSTGAVTDLGQFVPRAVLGDDFLAYAMKEEDDTALHVRDLRDGSEVVLPFGLPLVVAGGYVGFEREEGPGHDWNGDGDETDARVLEFHDLRSARPVPGAWAFGGLATSVHGTFGFHVSEREQGATDLDGDGDAFDLVFHVLDPASGSVLDTAITTSGFSGATDPDRYLFWGWEVAGGLDWNGDGDELDGVLHTYDPRTDELVNTGLASVFAVPFGEWLAVQVLEHEQGNADLDGDGSSQGVVVSVFHPQSQDVRNLGLGGLTTVGARHVVALRPELQADWNADGDRRDLVLFDWSHATGASTNRGIDALGILGIAGDRVILIRSEFAANTDLNHDGDLDDAVPAVCELSSSSLVHVGLAVGGWAPPSPSGRIPLLVSERGHGQELNGDQDSHDAVLHVLTPGP